MNKVIYLHYTLCPSPETLDKYFFINFLLSNSIQVEFWDITSLNKNILTKENDSNTATVVRINNKNEFIEKIKDQDKDNTIFINIFSYTWHSAWIDRLLQRNKCHTGFFHRPGLPNSQLPFSRKLYQLISKPRLGLLLTALLHRLAVFLKIIGLISEPKVVFSAGLSAIKDFENKTKVISINHFDYEHYLSYESYLSHSKDLIPANEDSYAVFLDENTPNHPDFELVNMKRVEPAAYYRGLNKFFDMVEKQYDIKIVIAAHPTSNYSQDVFQGRQIHKGKTNELVRGCNFVLAHGVTTSISFPVLHCKPIIFIYDNQFEHLYQTTDLRHLKQRLEILGGSIYNVDTIKDQEEITLHKVDLQKYESYKYTYLTSPQSEERLTQDLFLEYLKTNETLN